MPPVEKTLKDSGMSKN